MLRVIFVLVLAAVADATERVEEPSCHVNGGGEKCSDREMLKDFSSEDALSLIQMQTKVEKHDEYVKIHQSPIHGKGVFANRDFTGGDFIMPVEGKLVSETELENSDDE